MSFFVKDFNESKPVLVGEAHTHAAYSLRTRVGDYIRIFNGSGAEYDCRVKSIQKDMTMLEIVEKSFSTKESHVNFTLYMSVIKQDRFEFAVQKTTELGVKKIVPVYSEFTQRGGELKYDRFNKIAIAACEQSGRSVVPVIESAISFDELVKRANDSLVFPWERELKSSMSDFLTLSREKPNISIFIGPEGGITQTEALELSKVGAVPVTLGNRILRAETAAIATLSVLMYEMGEWNLC